MILITGASGSLGRALLEVFGEEAVVGATRAVLDLENPDSIIRTLNRINPNIVIHTAAVTDVDACELNPALAYRINWLATRYLAHAANLIDAVLVYVSTDYVFDGETGDYREHDVPAPLSVYGKSKLWGEYEVRSICPKYFVIRSSWIYSPWGRNLFSTFPAYDGRKPLRLLRDQISRPTYALDLAEAIGILLTCAPFGVYHIAGGGIATPLEFISRGFDILKRPAPLEAIEAPQLRLPAPRPRDTTLNTEIFAQVAGYSLPSWENSLGRLIARWKELNSPKP